ncbi:MAG: glycosyltransferase [Bacteroidota bacterium]|nr:glycosyltransferase [Bacteroidota bacterium]
MAKTFVTIYPWCENVHLTKDLGQIPYFMFAKHNYQAKLVTYKNSESYSQINGEVKGLELELIENKGKFGFLEKGILNYLSNNSKSINVLNLYHFTKQSFVYGILYKLKNPKGFLYLKLDAYNTTFEEGSKIKHSKKRVKNIFITFLESWFLKKVDLISIENTEGEKLVKLMYPKFSNKIIYLPVGVNDLFLKEEFKFNIKNIEEKENIILTTGRIGNEVKNHEMIMRALTQLKLGDWKMVFVGPIDRKFKEYVSETLSNYPHLVSHIIFTGEISNRKELYEWYNRSKLFCITSWSESFSLSIAEAFYFGNYILGTEGVMSMKDITDNQKYGTILKPDDDKSLASEIQKLINNQDILEKIYPNIIQHSHTNFVWSTITTKLQNYIQQH